MAPQEKSCCWKILEHLATIDLTEPLYSELLKICLSRYITVSWCLSSILLWLLWMWQRKQASFVQACVATTSLANLNQTWGHLLGAVSWAHFLVSSRTVTSTRNTSSKSVSTSLMHEGFVTGGSSFRDIVRSLCPRPVAGCWGHSEPSMTWVLIFELPKTIELLSLQVTRSAAPRPCWRCPRTPGSRWASSWTVGSSPSATRTWQPTWSSRSSSSTPVTHF